MAIPTSNTQKSCRSDCSARCRDLSCYHEPAGSAIIFKYDYSVLHSAAKMKPNWSCSICGMFSSRRFSVQRHIQGKHGGVGSVVRFVDYLIGFRHGYYLPSPKPSFRASEKSLHDKMREEADNVFVRRVVEECLPPGDPGYSDAVKFLKADLAIRGIRLGGT